MFAEVRLAESEIYEEAMWTEYPEQSSRTIQRERWMHEPEDLVYFLQAVGDHLCRRILEMCHSNTN
jgi:hypothetical protein